MLMGMISYEGLLKLPASGADCLLLSEREEKNKAKKKKKIKKTICVIYNSLKHYESWFIYKTCRCVPKLGSGNFIPHTQPTGGS